MKQKTLGILQLIIGLIFLGLFIFGTIVHIAVGGGLLEILIKDSQGLIVLLLLTIFAVATGWSNMKQQ